eukprot:SAG11_NODE_1664_length_4496_cov_1.786218_3_plen_59_part_00
MTSEPFESIDENAKAGCAKFYHDSSGYSEVASYSIVEQASLNGASLKACRFIFVTVLV